MNYLTDAIFPVRCAGGSRRMIPLSELHCTAGGDTPTEFAFTDPLLNACALEFAAAVLQMSLAPATEADWRKLFDTPPSSIALQAASAPYVKFFDAFGADPAFQNPVATKRTNIGVILHSEPRREAPISLQAAMIALIAAQMHAYPGGTGYNASLSGSGPLRTIPVIEGSLYEQAMMLVLPADAFVLLGSGSGFSGWLRNTNAAAVTRANGSAMLLHFALPRRYMLEEPTETGYCPILGDHAPLVSAVLRTNKGTKFPADGWQHPFTPYVSKVVKKQPKLLPMTANAVRRIGWQSRPIFVSGITKTKQTHIPAEIIRRAPQRLRNQRLRLLVYGAQCDKAKLLGILHEEQAFRLAPRHIEKQVESTLRNAVETVEQIEFELCLALAKSRCRVRMEHGQEKADITPVERQEASDIFVRTNGLVDEFQASVETSLLAGGQPSTDVMRAFIMAVAREALAIFDERADDRTDRQRWGQARQRLSHVSGMANVKAPFGLI